MRERLRNRAVLLAVIAAVALAVLGAYTWNQTAPTRCPKVGVCLVGQTASRFGRVELLTSEPLAQSATSTCRPVNNQLHASLHETHDHSHTWRCGKVDGYPPRGQ